MPYRNLIRGCTAAVTLVAALLSANAVADTARQRFLEAERALEQDDLADFRQLADTLTGYPLLPYLEYAALKRDLASSGGKAVSRFLDSHDDTPLAWQLRRHWLKQLAQRGEWQRYLTDYRPTSDIRLQCLQLRALIATGHARRALPRIEALWLHGRSRPAECDPVFDHWIKTGNPSPALAWQRIELAMAEQQVQLARYLGRFLPRSERRWLAHWLMLQRHPERLSRPGPPGMPAERLRQMQIHALRRLTRRDGLAALKQWQQLSKTTPFSPSQRHAVELRLAAALLDEPASAAYRYIRDLQPRAADHRLQELRLRAALIRADWQNYLHWLADLAPAIRDQERWQYWRARALSAQGRRTEALDLYRQLAEQRSYHGFIAADRAGLPYTLKHHEAPADSGLLEQLRHDPALQRARELLALDRTLEARREWQWGTRSLDRDGLLAAAKLAENWDWHDQAILTIARSEHWDDLELRFPLAYRQTVEDQAQRQDLDPAWIFAVARQESAFMSDARSSVGAVGLMQLMPATARHVARRLPGAPRDLPGRLDQPEVNITLGSAYLREVLDRLHSNRVLATAAYNAGPHRVRRWLPQQAMAADLWIERIPYAETRRYLRRVLTYSVIYQSRLGRPTQRLLEQMPDIQPAEDYARNETQRPVSG